jgi:hypothetical protein
MYPLGHKVSLMSSTGTTSGDAANDVSRREDVLLVFVSLLVPRRGDWGVIHLPFTVRASCESIMVLTMFGSVFTSSERPRVLAYSVEPPAGCSVRSRVKYKYLCGCANCRVESGNASYNEQVTSHDRRNGPAPTRAGCHEYLEVGWGYQ